MPQDHARGPNGEDKYAITRKREANGYGIRTSMYSVSHLGANDFSTKATLGRKMEKDALLYSKLHNVSRKDLHMQVFYPETVAKLQPPYGDLTRQTPPAALKNPRHPAAQKTRGWRDEARAGV